jgi:hypothetical protein
MTLRILLVAFAWVSTACSNADQHQSVTADSTERVLSATVTASSSERIIHPPSATEDSSAPQNGEIAALRVAEWRGSATPDQIDTLITAALNTRGAFTGDNEMYEFSGSKKAFADASKISLAVPRLVDCLGWDQRAASTYQGNRVLVGVVCHQVLIGNPEMQKLITTRGPNGYPEVWVDFRNPPLADVRKAQSVWRQLLSNQPK